MPAGVPWGSIGHSSHPNVCSSSVRKHRPHLSPNACNSSTRKHRPCFSSNPCSSSMRKHTPCILNIKNGQGPRPYSTSDTCKTVTSSTLETTILSRGPITSTWEAHALPFATEYEHFQWIQESHQQHGSRSSALAPGHRRHFTVLLEKWLDIECRKGSYASPLAHAALLFFTLRATGTTHQASVLSHAQTVAEAELMLQGKSSWACTNDNGCCSGHYLVSEVSDTTVPHLRWCCSAWRFGLPTQEDLGPAMLPVQPNLLT